MGKKVSLILFFLLPTLSGCEIYEYWTSGGVPDMAIPYVNPYDFGHSKIDQALNPYLNGSLHQQSHILETEPKLLKPTLIELIKQKKLKKELAVYRGQCKLSNRKYLCYFQKKVTIFYSEKSESTVLSGGQYVIEVRFSFTVLEFEKSLNVDFYKALHLN